MSADTHALALDPAPRSVQQARRWVGEVCRVTGRPDLVESAETGVSELVTNALLHAPGPIRLRVSGTRAHPRVEVHDASPVPPRPLPVVPLSDASLSDASLSDPLSDPLPGRTALSDGLDDDLLSTVGRGLRILASASVAWGAETHGDGKVVWFEPAPESRSGLTEHELGGTVYAAADTAAPRAPDVQLVEVRLPRVPVAQFARFRRHYLELRRELRLLALAHATDYPQAERLSELFADFEQDFGRAVNAPELLTAIAAGRSRVDLVLSVPVTAPATTARMVRLLDLADEFCAAARLLTLARDEEQAAFARWFLGELGRQAAGSPAMSWVSGNGGAPSPRYSTS